MRPLTITTATAGTALLLALTGCSSDDEPPTAGGTTTPAVASETALPEECLTADPANAPIECLPKQATPTGPPPPEGSSHYEALKLESIPGELRGTGNDVDVDKTSDSFSVTVQPGNRLGMQGVCEGFTSVDVKTVPDSGAAAMFSCGFNGAPSELGVQDPTPVTVATTYQVTISVPAPARWYVSLYQTDEPANTGQ